MNIAVLGAGALGCAIGGTLAQAGNSVVLINRNAAQVDAINTHGLVMCTPTGEQVVKTTAATSAQGLAPVDLVIVLVKSFHTEAAMAAATHLVGPHTAVLSLQNGLGHEDVLAQIVGREHVLAGKTYVGGVMLAPGRIVSGTEGKETLIGELDGSLSERAQRIAATFNAAGLTTTVSDNIVGTMWDKLLINVSTGAVSGITRLTYGPLYQIAEIEATAVAAVQEAMDVAAACGVKLSYTDPREAWRKASTGLPADFKTSMLQSLEKGSVTEIDFINGAVVRWGQRCGVPTPVNQTLVACIKGIEKALNPHAPPLRGSLPPEGRVSPWGGPAAKPLCPNKVTKRHHMSTPFTPPTKAYVEHVAVRVKDIHWHIRFFYEVLGMDVREIDGPTDDPRQYWTLGGMQFMAMPGFEAPPSFEAGWLAHLGVMVDDLEAALNAAEPWGVKALPQGRNWLQLPDGLAVELIQAAPGSVAAALAVKPRA